MKKTLLLTSVILAAGSAAYAQPAAPPPTEIAALKNSYNGIKANLTKAADRMPEADYSFKASPDIRTFGALIAHIADTQGRICAVSTGATPPESAEKKTSKADLVAALKASFDVCDPLFAGLTEADATKTINMGRGGPRSMIGTLWAFIIGHSNEEYGYLSVYMRIKGVVPPSTQP